MRRIKRKSDLLCNRIVEREVVGTRRAENDVAEHGSFQDGLVFQVNQGLAGFGGDSERIASRHFQAMRTAKQRVGLLYGFQGLDFFRFGFLA